jgi:hypothetical protein
MPTAPAKPSIDGAVMGRVMRQVMAHNKVVECEEMWAAHSLQQHELAEDKEHPGQSGSQAQLRAQPGAGTSAAAVPPRLEGVEHFTPATGSEAAQGQATCTGRNMEMTTASGSASAAPRACGCVTAESLREAREASARRKLRALAPDAPPPCTSISPTRVARDEDLDDRAERKRHRRERQTARAERRVAKKEKKEAKKARLRKATDGSPASSTGDKSE